MNKEQKKVKRFIELSKKFTKYESEVFTEAEINVLNENSGSFANVESSTGSYITFGSSSELIAINGRELYFAEDGTVMAKDKKEVKKSDKLRAHAEARATVFDEYQEYLELQKDLEKYYEALETL